VLCNRTPHTTPHGLSKDTPVHAKQKTIRRLYVLEGFFVVVIVAVAVAAVVVSVAFCWLLLWW
jgi:hypothetical protein